ncbi:MAG: P-loop NTPase [Actinomycetota bacterium]|nr:P-loop NTPase [Actinomycetota bacterium]
MTQPRIAAVGGNAAFVPLVARVLGTSPDDLVVISSVASAERAIAEGDRVFDVVVLGPTVAEKDAASLAEFVSKEVPTTAVIVVRDAPVDCAFPRLVRSGARDVVDISGGGTELREALLRAVDWAEGIKGTAARAEGPKTGEGAIVAIFSTKGGTGKTFFSCNLAAALAERTGQNVGLVDLDHDMGDVFAYFGATPKRSLPDLLLLEEGADSDEVTRLGTPLIDGVIGFGSTPDPRAEPLPSGAVTRMLRTLKNTFPFTVVDASAEYSDHVLAAFDLADAICLISGLDAIGIRHMTMGMQTLDRLGVPRDRVKIVLNRADSKVDLTPEDVEKLLGLTVDARIPSSSLVPRSINRAKLVWVEERRSEVSKAIEIFADRLRSQFSAGAELSATVTKRRLWKKG